MLMLTLQIVILLVTIALPFRTFKNKKGSGYLVDRDTSSATYAINKDGVLERINSPEQNSRIRS
jgi:hypothetical protein